VNRHQHILLFLGFTFRSTSQPSNLDYYYYYYYYYYYFRARIEIRLSAGQPNKRVSIPGRAKDFSPVLGVETDSGSHPTSYAVGTEASSLGG
jgi:hypothetical protein